MKIWIKSSKYCNLKIRFLADRFVGGLCPHCKFNDARGDQCDGCGRLLDGTELIEPKCLICGNRPTLKDTTHVFLNLDQLSVHQIILNIFGFTLDFSLKFKNMLTMFCAPRTLVPPAVPSRSLKVGSKPAWKNAALQGIWSGALLFRWRSLHPRLVPGCEHDC